MFYPYHRCEMKSKIALITEVVLVLMGETEKVKNIGEHNRIRGSETELVNGFGSLMLCIQ